MAITFSISNWSGWTLPGSKAADLPGSHIHHAPILDVTPIPALLRRRLNEQGRIAASQLLPHLARDKATPLVYCSRHGDIHRTLEVLQELARNEPVSPMNFSLAVHNAIPGVLSIHSQGTANITSLAAGDEGLVPTLLEAAGQLNQNCPRVLCLLCDVPLPEIYQGQGDGPNVPYAVCLVVTDCDGQGRGLRMEFNGPADVNTASTDLPEALRFADFLDGCSAEFMARHNGALWRISR